MDDAMFLASVLGGAVLFLLVAFIRIFRPGGTSTADDLQEGHFTAETRLRFLGFSLDRGGVSSAECGGGDDGATDRQAQHSNGFSCHTPKHWPARTPVLSDGDDGPSSAGCQFATMTGVNRSSVVPSPI